MKIFNLKLTQAKKVLNLQDKLEFMDDTITISGVYNNNPLNDMGVKTEISRNCNVYYFDKNGVRYPKSFIDLYYEEVSDMREGGVV